MQPVTTVTDYSHIDQAQKCSSTLDGQLPGNAQRLYFALLATALFVKRRRGYTPSTSRVTFHCPLEIVAHSLGMHRVTVWRHTRTLREAGLIDSRAHKTTVFQSSATGESGCNGAVRNDGTLWCIKLDPAAPNIPKLTVEELRHQWRDLERDIHAERTAYQVTRTKAKTPDSEVQQSKRTKDIEESVRGILAWALPPSHTESPLPLTVAAHPREALLLVLDVPYADFAERGEMVELAAASVSMALSDPHRAFYQWLLWQLLRLHDKGQDYFHEVFTLLERAATDHREGFSRSAGALFVSRLKQTDFWELLKSTPTTRVAPRRGANRGR